MYCCCLHLDTESTSQVFQCMEASMHSGAVVKCQMCVSVDPFIKDVFARHELFLTKPTCLGYAHKFCRRSSVTVWEKNVSFTTLPGSEFELKFDMLLFAELQAQAYCEAFPVQSFFVLLWQIHKRWKCQENICLFMWGISCAIEMKCLILVY